MQYFTLSVKITLVEQAIYEKIHKNNNYSFYITIGLHPNMHIHFLSGIYKHQDKDCRYKYTKVDRKISHINFDDSFSIKR